MKWLGPIGLVLTLASMVHTTPLVPTTSRSTSTIGDSLRKLTNQLIQHNTTFLDETMDVRTPPKVKEQVQDKMNKEEFSHAGVAIPLDEDGIEMDAVTKKMNFYKLEHPTTNSGISTWILLSGQHSPTTKKPSDTKAGEDRTRINITAAHSQKPRITKPIFKKKAPITSSNGTTIISTTTEKITTKISTPKTSTPKIPSTKLSATPTVSTKTSLSSTTSSSTGSSITTNSSTSTTTESIKKITRLTKIKASELNNAVKKSNTDIPNKKETANTTTKNTTISTIPIPKIVNSTVNNLTKTTVMDSSLLPLESKQGEVDLNNNETKKKTTIKRKKNKVRRRKPAKLNNSTSVSKPVKLHKEKPVGSVIYNYLSREIMPTVGVGLVGLMVTAGLASYFLYPFSIARRSYEVNRKDKEGSYYYNNDYSEGMLEEEAIGKVIAGMPSNSLFNDYKPKSSYPNLKYRLADRKVQVQPKYQDSVVEGTVESVPITNSYENKYQPVSYKNEIDEKKFVVGNPPKQIDDVTPITVPEHGPRSLNFDSSTERWRRAREPIYGPRMFRRRRSIGEFDTISRKSSTQSHTESLSERHTRSERSSIPDIVDENINEINSEIKHEIPTTISEIKSTTDLSDYTSEIVSTSTEISTNDYLPTTETTNFQDWLTEKKRVEVMMIQKVTDLFVSGIKILLKHITNE